MKRNKKGQFVKGTNRYTYNGFGIWFDKKGYPTIWINGKSIKLHVYVWEKENGEKPKCHDIHHKDYDKKNFDPKNLELLSYSDHRRVHAGWVRDGNMWSKKPCKICKKILPLNLFYQRKGLTPSNKCIECSSEENKLRLKTDSEFREKKRLYLKEYYKKNREKILKKQRSKQKEVARG